MTEPQVHEVHMSTQHAHALYAVPGRSATCDVRRVSFCGGKMWSCVPCNFDVCDNCVQPAKSVPGRAVAPTFPPHVGPGDEHFAWATVAPARGGGGGSFAAEAVGPLVDGQLRLFQGLTSAGAQVCSPLSLQTALYVALAAATPGSTTAAQLQRSWGAHLADPATVLRALQAVQTPSPGIQLIVANAVFSRGASAVRPEFVARLQGELGAEVYPLTDGAAINTWCQIKTRDHIRTLMAPGPIEDDTVVVNAVYFKGTWATPFDVANTRADVFASASRGPQPCQMMRKLFKADSRLRGGAVDAAGTLAVRMPYAGGGAYEAWFVTGSDDVVSQLPLLWPRIAALGVQTVDLSCPRFKVDSNVVDCIPVLQGLGIEAPFVAQAGFLAGFTDPRMYVSQLVHRAVCEVNEEGTVAAAATAVGFNLQCMVREPPPLVVRLDKPFVFAVVHAKTSTPLFIGRVCDV